MLALFSSIGWQEMFLLFFIGLLLYGRNLPDAGRSLGRVVAQLKRSFQDFKDQIDRDGELRDVKKAISDTAREVKNVAKVPRAMANPTGALRDLTHEAMSAPVDSDSDHAPFHDLDDRGVGHELDDDPVVEVEHDPIDPDDDGAPAPLATDPNPAASDPARSQQAETTQDRHG